MRAEVRRRAPKDGIADVEAEHARTDRLDRAREVDAERGRSWPPKPEDQPPEERAGATRVRVCLRNRGRSDADEDLVVLRDAALDLVDPEDARRPVPILDDGLHASHRSVAVSARGLRPPVPARRSTMSHSGRLQPSRPGSPER